MTKEQIETLYNLYNEFEDLVVHAFSMMDKAGILDFWSNTLEKFEISGNSEFVDIIYSDYGYDLYDSSSITIPTSILGNDDKIKKFIEEYKKNQEKEEQLQQERAEKEKIEEERKEYERLKSKFEHL